MSSSAWPLCLPTRLTSREDTRALPGSEIMKRIFFLIFALCIFLAGTTPSSPATLLAAHKANGSIVHNTTSSLGLVLLNSTDGLPHWGQQVTFNVSTTATTEPHVSLKCSQNGVVAYSAQSGFYASYPWPWTQVMTLSSAAWTSGSADCVASLYYFSGTNTVTVGTLSFTAY